MPDGISPRPSSDTLQLLKLMSMRSEIVELRLAAEPESSPPLIEELPPAAPSVLDQLVQARVRIEEQALAEETPTGLAAPLFADPVPEVPDHPAAVERISSLQPEAWAEDISILEMGEPAADEPDVDLLELNAAEAGQPLAFELADIEPLDLPSFDVAPADVEAEPPAPAAPAIEPDDLLTQPLESAAEIDAILALDEASGEEGPVPSASEDDQPAIEALTEAAELEAGVDEGPGEDFQALLSGARQLESGPPVAPREPADDEDVPLLPAEGDVKLRARNGPKPGAEFVGKSTLAGANGLYCLIERFDLPAGTRMKLTLTAPRDTDRFEILDALVKRVRRAPENTTEVQLAFEHRHADFEDFVAQHFGDQPVGFTLFTRRRPKR